MKNIISISVREKIILHLLEHFTHRELAEAPHTATLDGISADTGIRVPHVSRAMKTLTRDGAAVEKKLHVVGETRKRKTYFLTEKGYMIAKELRARIEAKTVSVEFESGTQNMRISELMKTLKTHVSFLQLLRYISTKDRLVLREIEDELKKAYPPLQVVKIPKPPEEFLSPLVGRENEQAKLKQFFDAATCGRGNVVMIEGEVGIGKSRLCYELYDYASKNAEFLIGRCLQQEQAVPFLPFIEMLRPYSSQLRFDEMPAKISDETGLDMYSQIARTQLFERITRLIRKLSLRRPLVLFIDDLHWADPSSVQLFVYLARNLKNTNVLICGTYRPEELESTETRVLTNAIITMRREHLLNVIHLERLTPADVKKMCTAILKMPAVPENFVDMIYRETEGNPLFVEEMLKYIVAEKLVEPGRPESFANSEHRRLRIPAIIKDTIIARINRLNARYTDILRYAAVIGEEFSFELLKECCGLEPELTLDALEQFLRHMLIQRRVTDGKELYRFTHSKIHDVIYEELSQPRREYIHRRVGETIERLYADELDKMTYSLAHHFFRANVPQKAFKYLMQAGNKAAEIFAYEEAISYYEQAQTLIENTKVLLEQKINEKLSLSIKLADMYRLTGAYGQALALYNNALRTTNDEKVLAELNRKLGLVHEKLGKYDESLQYYRAALGTALEFDAHGPEVARIYNAIGWTYQKKSEYDEAIKWNLKALRLAKKKYSYSEVATSYHMLGTNYWAKSNYKRAVMWLSKAIQLRKKMGDLHGLAQSYNNISIVWYSWGEHRRAVKYNERGLAILRRLNDMHGIAAAYTNLGILWYEQGDSDKALEYHTKALSIFEKIGHLEGIAASYDNIGVLWQLRGDFARAIEFYDKSLAIKEKTGNINGIASSYNNIGEVHKELEAYDKALNCFRKSSALFQKTGNKNGLMATYCNMAESYLSTRKLWLARRYCIRLQRLAQSSGAQDMLAWGLRIQSKIYSISGCRTEAEEACRKSISIFERLGRVVDAARSKYEYASILATRAKKTKMAIIKKYLAEALRVFESRGIQRDIRKATELLQICELKTGL